MRYGGRRTRRDEVVAAATEAFAQGGYSGASLRDIATRINMSPAGVLHHFGSKEGLLTAVLSVRDRDEVGEDYYPSFPRGQAYLDHLVRTVRRNAQRRGITQLYTVLSGESVADEHPAQDWFRDRYAGLRTIVDEALREATGLPEGEFEEESRKGAEVIIATLDGVQIQWLLDESVSMPAAAEYVIDLVVADLKAKAQATNP